MSHLSTIISRVKHREKMPNFLNDSLFWQSIVNLQEYQEAWNDFTKEEQEEADKLFTKYRDKMPKKWVERLEGRS